MDAPTPDITGWNTGSSDQVSTRNGRDLSDPRTWMVRGTIVLVCGMFILGGLYLILADHPSWGAAAILALGIFGLIALVVVTVLK